MLIWNHRGPTIHPVSDPREIALSCDTGKSDSATCSDLMRAVQPRSGPQCLEMTPSWRARAVSGANRPPRASSRANGTKFARPRKVDDVDHIATARRMKADGHTGRDIAK